MATVTLSTAAADALPEADLIAAIPRLRRYARVLTRNPWQADDLVQDTLARAWDKRRLWRQGTDLRAWLFTVMHNIYANQRTLRQREAATISLDAESPNGAGFEATHHGNQLDRVELSEVAQRVRRLPAEQRDVLLLAAVEQLTYDEIATMLAIPVGTVMSRLSRARDKLRGMMMTPQYALEAVEERKEAESAS
jgi:RNA polymerase sigma-70 factor (ECF subfamily)